MTQSDPFIEIASSSGKSKPIKNHLAQLTTNAMQSGPPKVPHEVLLLQQQALQIQQEINHHYLAPEDAVVLSEDEDRAL